MYIFNAIDELNLQIKKVEEEIEKLIHLLAKIEKNPNNFVECFDEIGINGAIDLGNTTIRQTIYRKISTYKEEELLLKERRNSIIDKFIAHATFTPAEIISILKLFGIYYKCGKVNGKTLLMPEGLVLSNRIIPEEELHEMLAKYLYPDGNAPVPDTLVVPMYVMQKLYHFCIKEKDDYVPVNEKPLTEEELPAFMEEQVFFGHHLNKKGRREITSRIIPNDCISTLASTMEVGDKGISLYQRKYDNVVLNGKILNILPEEVLGFVDSYIMEKWENPLLTIDEAFQQYQSPKKLV